MLNTWALGQNGYANVYYSAGVKSMLRSWHNFLFLSADPAGLISIDKPPLGLWLQAASAEVFGFSPLSLLLPQAIAGVAAVAALYVIVRKRFGTLAASASALTLAVFPAFVAVSRDNNVDTLLILLMTLACGAALRATETGRLRVLLGSAVLVALAFNTKALAAYLVVPGIAAGYLCCAPAPPRHRVGHVLLAGVVCGVLSLAWMVAVDLTPAAQRPFVGSSTDNSELGLTFGYNGFGRVGGQNGGPGPVANRESLPQVQAPAASSGASGATAAPAQAIARRRAEGAVHDHQEPGRVRHRARAAAPVPQWLRRSGRVAARVRARRPGRDRADTPGAPRPAARRADRVRRLPGVRGGLPERVERHRAPLLRLSAGARHGGDGRCGARRDGAPAAASAAAAADRRRAGHGRGAGRAAAPRPLPAPVAGAADPGGGRRCADARSHGVAFPGRVWRRARVLLVAPTAYAATTWRRPVQGTFPAAGPRAVGGNGGAALSRAQLDTDRR